MGSLDRLAIVGSSGMGALTYRPVISLADTMEEKRLDEIAVECECILNTETYDNLDYLFAKGGSSGGARPKILTKVDGKTGLSSFHLRMIVRISVSRNMTMLYVQKNVDLILKK